MERNNNIEVIDEVKMPVGYEEFKLTITVKPSEIIYELIEAGFPDILQKIDSVRTSHNINPYKIISQTQYEIRPSNEDLFKIAFINDDLALYKALINISREQLSLFKLLSEALYYNAFTISDYIYDGCPSMTLFYDTDLPFTLISEQKYDAFNKLIKYGYNLDKINLERVLQKAFSPRAHKRKLYTQLAENPNIPEKFHTFILIVREVGIPIGDKNAQKILDDLYYFDHENY